MRFKVGDKVKVVTDAEHWFKMSIHKHPRHQEFTVIDVADSRTPCCTGHLEHIRVSPSPTDLDSKDSGWLSGMWFDPERNHYEHNCDKYVVCSELE